MAMRGYKRRGRPPKTPNATPRFLNAKSSPIEKPKWLHGRWKPDGQSTNSTDIGPDQPRHVASQYTPRSRGRPRGRRSAVSVRAPERESEYHYGSDFFSGSDSDSNLDDKRSTDVESDVDFETTSLPDGETLSHDGTSELTTKGPTPLPIWLEERSLPTLTLPESSQDLLLPARYLLDACSVYEVLRRFSNLLRLAPFRYEDFLAALRSEEYSFLLGEIHVVLLKALLREEDLQQTSFGPLDQKDSINSVLQFSDGFAWPAVLKAYFQSDRSFSVPLQILDSCEYPFTTIENKLAMLKFMIDLVLLTTPIREDLVREGQTRYEDHCRNCHRMGDLLCCEVCPAVYHLECVEPALSDVPNGDWLCPTCALQQVKGVTDCVSEMEKSGLANRLECLGYDRHGRKYWFVCRRIFVESEDGAFWYYSNKAAFEELLSVLDADELEASLCREINMHREEILQHMEITEELTTELKGDKTTVLEKFDAWLAERANQKKTIEATNEGDGQGEEQGDNGETVTSTPSTNGSAVALNSQGTEKSASSGEKFEGLLDDSLYRLGEEGTFKNYTNVYSTNTLALNKFQHAEERDRKRYLSHKFSLTPAAEFKWSSSIYGQKTAFLQALRGNLLNLRDSMHSAFMHTNWHIVRKAWTTAVTSASTAREFSRTLAVLAMCIRPIAYNNLWFDSLGHTLLARQSAQEREVRKKLDKKEKKEKEMEEDMYRMHTVHYTLGVKHQLWKIKGEEFRSHGQWGWLWVSAARPKRKNIYRASLLQQAQKIREESIQGTEAESSAKADGPVLDDLINVSQEMNDPVRKVYAKVAKPRKLDALLAWRLSLKELEEKEAVVKIEKAETHGEQQNKLHQYACYSLDCGSMCYSSLCRFRQANPEVNASATESTTKSTETKDALASTCRKYALKKLPVAEEKKTVRVPVPYPRSSSFSTRSGKKGLFVLETSELRRLARKYGQFNVPGFIPTAKANPSAWPYPSYRPAFRTCWLYRTSLARSLTDVALQLRILWTCLKWDDMQAKPPTVDGKNQVTTETEIITTEILKHRTTGRFLEKTQYQIRRVVIPLELPETVREVTPSRFGLRKRKKVETPRLSEPQVSEDWVEENKIELWEIKQYYERSEKAAAAAAAKKTNALTGLFGGTKATPEQLAKLGVKTTPGAKIDQTKLSQLPNTSRVEISGKTYLRFTIPGGKAGLQGANSNLPVTKNTLATLLASSQKTGGNAATGVAKQVLVQKSQPEIAKKIQPATPDKPNQIMVVKTPGASNVGVQQKLHISRTPDGKFLVRGLLPGQRLVQLADGKFQLVGTPTVQKTAVPVAKAATTNVTTNPAVVKQPDTPSTPQTAAAVKDEVVPDGSSSGKTENVTDNAVKAEEDTVELDKSSTTEVKEESKPATNVNENVAKPAAEKPTALLVQTTQGPRIILQGLQGNSLSSQELQAIQEQVKSQLLKAQALKQQKDKGAKAVSTPLQIKVGIPPQKSPPVAAEKQSQAAAVKSENDAGESSENEFVVTRDFIQQTIRKALKQENLTPDMEHKLLQLHRYQEKQKTTTGTNIVPHTQKKKTAEEINTTEPARETPVREPSVQVKETPMASSSPVVEKAVTAVRTAVKTVDRRQAREEKLEATMVRHAENLRRAMLRYRENFQKTQQEPVPAVEPQITVPERRVFSPSPPPKREEVASVSNGKASKHTAVVETTDTQSSQASAKRKRKSEKDKSLSNKKTLHCVCKTPYDSSRFYVGCDVCLNWFHGDCIGITEEQSQTMTEYVCAECLKAKENNEIFCLCRQPYDESQFYICCDTCQDWFHGHCVGILQAEADMIDEYNCPKCQPDSPLNDANLRLLSAKDYEKVTEVVRSLLKNRNSWPFREAVNPHSVPNYYEVIKDPIDLTKILSRLSSKHYRRLAEVVGDITKMFENCRYFNSNDSSIYRCAEALESYFVPRLHNIRKILTES